MTDKIHCEDCRFWEYDNLVKAAASLHDEGHGECRRRAARGPITYYRGSAREIDKDHQTIISGFARTASDDWCGEAEIAEAEGKSR